MDSQIKEIVVVGGGTAGWMSAAYLQKKLGGASGRSVKITVVESDDVEVIGVGEATIPSFIGMMRTLGIPEYRLFAEADATFKNAIKFVDWYTGSPGDAKSGQFYHPFDPPPIIEEQSALLHWLALKNAGVGVEPAHATTSIGSALCDANRSPKVFASGPYDAPIPYAFHIDAIKLGRLLRTVAIERGVVRVVDHVVSGDLDDSGNIVELQTRDGREIRGDFFVDCTGFQGLLIEKLVGIPFENYNDRLLCDRALACQVPRAEKSEPPRCYTTATAKEAGWIWEIDLSTRSGFGYVYSSRFVSDERALATLMDHIGHADRDLKPRNIELRVGRRREAWAGNCVAIGLSAGFLEPLESTGIHLIELGLRVFADHIAEGGAAGPMRDQYNRLMKDVYEEISDFLVMHYIFNNRLGEPFWDYCRDGLVLPPRLVAKLNLWAYKTPSLSDLAAKINVFDGFSYFYILAGMNALPPFGGNLSPFLNLTKSANTLDEIVRLRANAVRASPPHQDMIQKLRASAG